MIWFSELLLSGTIRRKWQFLTRVVPFLIKRGASLVLTGRNRDNLEKVASECESAIRKPLTIIANLDKENEVANIVKGEN